MKAILIFINGQFFFAGQTHVDRPDVAEASNSASLQRVGFNYIFPAQPFRNVDSLEVRFFAVSQNGVASELIYPNGYRLSGKRNGA